jgi:hypothetical protein
MQVALARLMIDGAIGGPRSVASQYWPFWMLHPVPAGRITTIADIAADPHITRRAACSQTHP